MGISGKQSTIDRNGAGGDCGVSQKRNEAIAALDKMKQTGMPKPNEKNAVGATPRPGSATYSGGGKPAAQKSVPGGKKKQ